jgi:Flp pilus assembly protein TadG
MLTNDDYGQLGRAMKGSEFFRHLGRISSSFWYDTSGIILPYVAVLLFALVGVSLLALDGGRAYSLQTQLQNIADAAALAGAAELNRAPGARARATNAINNLVSNRLAGMDVTDVTLRTPVFYETLPQADQYFSSGTEASEDGFARFVAVTLTHTMDTIFPVSFLNPGATNSYTAAAQAVAGFDQVACKYTPMFICNPFEQTGDTYDEATGRLLNAGTSQLITLQSLGQGGGSQYSPGNYGFLQSSTLTATGSCGAGNAVTQAVARSRPPVCFNQSSVNFHPGAISNANDAINTRFDIFDKSFGNCEQESLYPPAPNVRKGYLAHQNGANGPLNWCKADPCDNAAGLCQDKGASWPSGGPPAMGFPLDSNAPISPGNGIWNCSQYWSVAHPNALGSAPTGCTNTATISRSSVYNYEIKPPGFVSDLSPGVPVTTQGKTVQVQESGSPQCSNTLPDADRRNLYVAIINCRALEDLGYSLNGSATNVPVVAFAKFFLTLPVPTNLSAIYAEFDGIVTPGDSGAALYYQVQLYR